MGKVVGIDLGTTNCCVAALVDGSPQVLFDEPDAHGLSLSVVPSFVKVGPQGPTYVGSPARRDALEDPAGVIYAAKRLIGRAFDDEVVQTVMATVPYEIIRGPDHNAMFRVAGVELSPEDVAAELLRYLRQLASSRLGEAVTDAVITVPAHFNSRQREATKRAGERAGLTVLRLINEPTAAALVFGHDRNIERTVAVYDLGGGTFDISILEIGDGVYEVMATGGDTFLGGVDFDNRLVTHLMRRDIMPVTKQPIDPISMLRLKRAAEIAKIQLSSTEEAEVRLRSFLDMDELVSKVSRSELETVTTDLIGRTLEICDEVIKDAGIAKSDIEELILVGGQTRMPKLREVVSEYFQRWPNVRLNPDEVVAMGAALHAGALAVSDTSTLLLDVTPLTLGIASVADTFTPVLEKNTKVPCTVSRLFSTARDNQEQVKIVVLQGENGNASKNVLLGEFTLEGIPRMPRFQPRIEVTFRLDANGMLHVSALDQDTGLAQEISIRGFIEGAVETAGTDVALKDQAPKAV